MIVLSRRIGETLIIGDDIKLTVLDAEGNRCNLGIEAPRDVNVVREEVYDADHPEAREAREG